MLPAPQRVGLACGALGAVLLTLGRHGSGASIEGDAIMFVWVGVFAGYSFITRMLTETYPPLFVSALAWGGGFAILSLAGAASVPRAVAHTMISPPAAVAAAAAVVFLGVVAASGIVAPAAHASAVRSGGVAVATAGSQYASLATGLALSFAVLGESLGPFGLAGLALTLLPPKSGTPANAAAARLDLPEIR